MKTVIQVESICSLGCSNFIHKSLGAINGVYGIHVDVAKNEIVVDHTNEVDKQQLTEKLIEIGLSQQTDCGFKQQKL